MAANTITAAGKWTPPSSLFGVIPVLASIALSIASYGHLGETVRIRWTVGSYYHYGPEYASTLGVLVAFPVVVAALSVGAYWIERSVQRHADIESAEEFRIVYGLAVALTLGLVVACQLIIVVLNLW